MSRKYNRTKGSGSSGAGLHFDKLLKACSNSSRNKPGVNKTAGALGRFGNVCFTSTRSSGLDMDSSGEEESSSLSLSKRARFSDYNPLAHHSLSPVVDNYNYHNPYALSPGSHPLTPPNVQLNLPMPIMPVTVIKPRKFFKSRGAMEVEKGSGIVIRSEVPESLPPPPPIIKDDPKDSPKSSKVKPTKAKGKRGRPGKKQAAIDEANDKTQQGNICLEKESPPRTNENLLHNSSSPGIKLRIFKDKRTSTLRSVSETADLPSDVSPQDDENTNASISIPKKTRGRPKAAHHHHHHSHSNNVELVIPQPHKRKQHQQLEPSSNSRATRRSKRHRNSGSSDPGEMPLLTSEDPIPTEDIHSKVETEMEQLFGEAQIPSSTKESYSPEKLVQQLQNDKSYCEISAALSSMEEEYPNPLPQQQQQLTYSDHLHVPLNIPHPNPQHDLQPSPIRSKSPDKPTRDFRSILEDDWDDFDDDGSPKKSNHSTSPNVSRFEMDEINVSPERQYQQSSSSASYPISIPVPTTTSSIHLQQFYPDTLTSIPSDLQFPQQTEVQSKPFNAPYAVRNLLSEITEHPVTSGGALNRTEDNVSEFDAPQATPASHPAPTTNVMKKTSIFKSRNQPGASSGPIASSSSSEQSQAPNPKKRLALYKHQFGQQSPEDQTTGVSTGVPPGSTLNDDFEDYDEDIETPLGLRRVPVSKAGGIFESDTTHSKVLCSSGTKKLFTVIKNVKAVHELQESGEVHEFDGDIWYILSDLKDSNPMATRCLAGSILASRCMEPGFRMHLRAHGTVSEFCKELHDSPNNPVLALMAATVLFVLSQDRLNMDLDTESLRLILSLAKTDSRAEAQCEDIAELSKHRQRAIDLVREMKNRGHAEHIKLEKITASELSLETLLFLTSKRAGEWVKKELRSLGGLEFIVYEIQRSLAQLESPDWTTTKSTDSHIETLWRVDRCLKVLHQVTFNHEENQKYLLGINGEVQFSSQVFVDLFKYLCSSLGLAGENGSSQETCSTWREVLFSTLRVLVNLTHDYRGIIVGSEALVGKPDFLPLTLHSIFELSTSFPDGKGFDLLMHSLCMLVNLVEHSKKNRLLISTMPINPSNPSLTTLDGLIQMFFEKENEAMKEEASTDDILAKSSNDKEKDKEKDSQESGSSQESNNNGGNSIIDRLIQTAGRNMESSMIAAQASLLIAYLIMDSPESIECVRNSLPGSKFLPFMIQLKKLFNFMSITTAASGLKAISVGLKFYSKYDPDSAEELKKIIPE